MVEDFGRFVASCEACQFRSIKRYAAPATPTLAPATVCSVWHFDLHFIDNKGLNCIKWLLHIVCPFS
jgi:hypothetical protein